MDTERKRRHDAAQAAKIAASVNVKNRRHLEPPDNESSVVASVDWSFWKAMRTVKLWQACALLLDVDPDTLKQHPETWMNGSGGGPVFEAKSFPSAIIHTRFDKALRLAANAVSYTEGPIVPHGQPRPGSNKEKDVLLSEVAAFFHSCEWLDIPEPLQFLATPAGPLTITEPSETTEERQDRRLKECTDAGLKMDKTALSRLPDGVGDVANSEGVSRQSFSADVKAALTRKLDALKAGFNA